MKVAQQHPVAVVTGGSAGLGLEIVRALLSDGYRVLMVGRDPERLAESSQRYPSPRLSVWTADVSQADQVQAMIQYVQASWGRLDVLVNAVGVSDRGRVDDLTPQRVHQLVEANVVTALLCSQAALPLLMASGGSVINVGSLAAKVGAPFLGGYPLAKHALAGLTQQMRQEWHSRGVHVGLINPGPIRRDDAGRRYTIDDPSVPASAAKPAGGAKIKGLPADAVAQAVLRMIRKRQPDLILPGKLRGFIALGHLAPRLGGWLLRRFSGGDG